MRHSTDRCGRPPEIFLLICGFLCVLRVVPLAAQTTELRFVTWKSEAPEVWQQALADFERLNPGVKVVSEIGPQSSTQLHDLLTQKLRNRDTRLDVFVMDVVWPAEFASAMSKDYASKYHQPSDEYSESWDFSGMEQCGRFGFTLGLEAANAPRLASWKDGDEFLAERVRSGVN